MEKSPKQVALRMLQSLPDDVTYEDIMYELYVIECIEQGLQDAEEGKLIPHSEVMRDALEWLKSSTRPARA